MTTFCLSDIVGSTALWDTIPARWQQALVRHDELVAGAVESHGGRFLKSKGEGDATFSVFESASGACEAAIAATRALGAERWPNGWSIAARFGIHTGEAEAPRCRLLRPGGQPRGARARTGRRRRDPPVAAHGGSDAKHLPAGYSLVDLGPHRLRGRRKAADAARGRRPRRHRAGAGDPVPLPRAAGIRSGRPRASSSGARTCSARSSSGSRRGACSRSWARRAAGSPRCCAPA